MVSNEFKNILFSFFQNHNLAVAIKRIPKGKLGKSQPLLGKEIKILQELTKLKHKNIVALLECVDSPKFLSITIEYCNGGDLAEYLNIKGSLSEDTIRLFLRQIAEAMVLLKEMEVVHRDLKPQNILLCHSGKPNPPPEEITLKIADFGFARFLNEGVMAATLCGSPMYMAPEVIMSLKYDAKADLWSIGTVVYQCLTGKAPFMAPNPQQLKHYYEKNANLAPSIPNGTSPELTDLLLHLMKRDAKDRMDVEELYNHPFLKALPRSSSPVPVPIRRSVSPCTPTSPYSSSATHSWEREVGGEDMAQSNSSLSPSLNNSEEQRYSPPMAIEQDFVVVPSNIPDESKLGENKNSHLKHQLSDPNVSPSKIPVTNKAFKKAMHGTNINLAAKAVKYQMMQVSSESDAAQASSNMQISENIGDSHLADAVPVPTQKNAYKESLRNTAGSSPLDGYEFSKTMLSPGTSPTLKDSVPLYTERNRKDSTNSSGSDPFRITDLSSMTPPSVQFTIGTPPTGGRLRSFSGSTPPPAGSGRQTPTSWRHQAAAPQNYSTSPLRRSGGRIPEAEGLNFIQRSGSSGRLSDTNLLMGHFALSGNGASPSPPLPSLLAFNVQQQKYTPSCQHHCCCGGQSSPGRIRRNSYTGAYSDSSPTCHYFPHSVSPSSLEGLFIPELPEETLLEKEHNDTLAKLNFVSALVKCILELAKTRSSPLSSALSSSIARTDQDTDQAMSEGCRKAVQLLLYMKALQLISSAFQLSQQEVKSGKLQPSTSVRNVLHLMKENYHFCLSMCKSLNTPGLLQSVGVDPAASSITADQILYKYAIQMCQSAALEELFGEPKESFHRYQTAQILLHSLGQQVNDLSDKELLHKYRDAVQKRLEILTNNRSVYAYHAT
ncbi:serine/threonine-protein kinase unc-51 isoform X4 [Parasteatoda tepidariorum]|uniref:serine/threonine-protein kinase unc-51 isoform X4 n=1 Tax=Parasteatoda tepidariorum TaxID=114398 RepID=UPI0039BCBDCA